MGETVGWSTSHDRLRSKPFLAAPAVATKAGRAPITVSGNTHQYFLSISLGLRLANFAVFESFCNPHLPYISQKKAR